MQLDRKTLSIALAAVAVLAIGAWAWQHFAGTTALPEGLIQANRVVVATGPFQRPVFPRIVPEAAGLVQLHSADYRNPEQLPEGGRLVEGAADPIR